ncbi:unnamed protein product [Amoebophrya sp. A25]|nr:unnamed protein product [Amoebophrya sp. A25]|eukprot:GSA25T00022618001.1
MKLTGGFLVAAVVYFIASATQLPAVEYALKELKFPHKLLILTALFLFQACCLPAYFMKELLCGTKKAADGGETAENEDTNHVLSSGDEVRHEDDFYVDESVVAKEPHFGQPRQGSENTVLLLHTAESPCAQDDDDLEKGTIQIENDEHAFAEDERACLFHRDEAGKKDDATVEMKVSSKDRRIPNKTKMDSCRAIRNATLFLMLAGSIEVLSKYCQVKALDLTFSSLVTLVSSTKLIFISLTRTFVLKADWPVWTERIGMILVATGVVVSAGSILIDEVRLQESRTSVKAMLLGLVLSLTSHVLGSVTFVFQEFAGRMSPNYSSFLAAGVQGSTALCVIVTYYGIKLAVDPTEPPLAVVFADVRARPVLQVLFAVFFFVAIVAAVSAQMVVRKNAGVRVVLENLRSIVLHFVEPLILVSQGYGRNRFRHDRFQAYLAPLGHVIIVVGALLYFEFISTCQSSKTNKRFQDAATKSAENECDGKLRDDKQNAK